jgi:NhaP-type Na+/H+ or K+/H+ antiporter
LSFSNQAEHFIIIFFGGSAIRLGIAPTTLRLHTLMNDPLSEISLTIATVFGSVAVANSLGVSALVAVAVAGLYFGKVTIKKAAASLYLEISMNEINIIDIAQHFPIIVLSLVAVFGARATTAYSLLAATTKFTREKKLPKPETHRIGWRNERCHICCFSCISSTWRSQKYTTKFLSLIVQYVVL